MTTPTQQPDTVNLTGAASGSETVPAQSSLAKFRADLKLTTSSGARLEYSFPSGKADAHKTLIAAFGELARIGAVAGLEQELREAMHDSFGRVADWRSKQEGE